MAVNELVMSNEDISRELSSTSGADETGDVTVSDEADHQDDDLVPSSWDDDEDGQGDTEATDEDSAAQTKKSAKSVRQYKANGKVHEIDHADTARVDQLITMGLGARQVFSELDKLKKASKSWTTEKADLQQYKDTFDKMNRARASGNREALYELVFKEKWADVVKRAVDEHNELANATDEQRVFLQERRATEQLRRELAEMKAAIEAEKAETGKLKDQADLKETKATLTPAYHKYGSQLGDDERGDKLRTTMWRLALAEIKAMGEEVNLTPALAEKVFKDTFTLLNGNAQAKAKEQVKQITQQKKAKAKEQAQAQATRNLDTSDDEFNKKLAAAKGDPVGVWRLFKNRK